MLMQEDSESEDGSSHAPRVSSTFKPGTSVAVSSGSEEAEPIHHSVTDNDKPVVFGKSGMLPEVNGTTSDDAENELYEPGQDDDYVPGYGVSGREGLVSCNICHGKMLFRNMSRHMKTHSREEKVSREHRLVRSHNLTTERSEAKKAVEYVHSNRRKSYACQICEKEFWKNWNLKKHMLSMHPAHTDETAGILSCNICGRTYRHHSSLHYHQLTHKAPQYECEHCGVKLITSSALKRHIESAHGLIKIHCHLCKKIFKDLQELAVHLDSHTLQDFANTEQTKGSRITGDWKLDETTMSDNDDSAADSSASDIVCGHCDETFSSMDEMKQHFASTHQDILSESEYAVSNELDAEEPEKSEKDLMGLICGICDEELNGMSSLKEHIIDAHPELLDSKIGSAGTNSSRKLDDGRSFEKVSCGRCDELFDSVADLNKHITNSHSDEVSGVVHDAIDEPTLVEKKTTRGIRCGHCDGTFATIQHMNVHIKETHSGLLSSIMQKTERIKKPGVRNKDDGELHDLMETTRENVLKKLQQKRESLVGQKVENGSPSGKLKMRNAVSICPYCHTNIRWDGLKSHINRVHYKRRNVTCEVCDKKFFDNVTLKKHYIASHREELSIDAPSYKCNMCDVTYTSRSSLHSHKQVKHKDTRFKCWYCGRAFGEISTLNKHLLLHDMNSVRCRICHFAYKDWSRLKVHMARVHPEVKYENIEQHGVLNKERDTLLARKSKSHPHQRLINAMKKAAESSAENQTPEESSAMVVEMDETALRSLDVPIQLGNRSVESVVSAESVVPVESVVPAERVVPGGDTEIPDVFLCQICKAEFRDYNDLITHCVTVHPDTLQIVYE